MFAVAGIEQRESLLLLTHKRIGMVSRLENRQLSEKPLYITVCGVMVKQISAVCSNVFEQSEIWVGICFGMYDTVASTITIGLDLWNR